MIVIISSYSRLEREVEDLRERSTHWRLQYYALHDKTTSGRDEDMEVTLFIFHSIITLGINIYHSYRTFYLLRRKIDMIPTVD